MSQAAAAAETSYASGRYSKRKRTQVNYRMEELDFDETDNETEEETVKAKKQRRTAASRPLPKRKIFPFLQLPAEIRNMIYDYALTEPSGVKFVAVQRHRRRCVERVSAKTFEEVAGDGYWHRRAPYQPQGINDKADEQAASLTPSLLAVNKQIHQEACNFLYGNELVFADSVALYAFMINLGPGSASHLKKITIKSWDHGRTTKAYNNACFAALIWAGNLERLYIDVGNYWYGQPKHAAQQLYRDAFPWLEAVGRGKGKFDAALDVVAINADCLGGRSWGSQSLTDAQKLKLFNDELSKNLGAQQKRVMAISKKRKIAKVSN